MQLTVYTGHCHRPQCHRHRRLLDRHILPSHLCGNNALHGSIERYLRSPNLPAGVTGPLHRWYNPLLRRRNPHHHARRPLCAGSWWWRRHHSRSRHLHGYCSTPVSVEILWHYVGARRSQAHSMEGLTVLRQGAWALGTCTGPVFGGAFVEHGTWRWIFYLMFPFVGRFQAHFQSIPFLIITQALGFLC